LSAEQLDPKRLVELVAAALGWPAETLEGGMELIVAGVKSRRSGRVDADRVSPQRREVGMADGEDGLA
jgi:hypothetical protein